MALGSVTTSRTFIRPPHFEQTVTSTAKTRARRCAQPMRRGVALTSRRSSGRPARREKRERHRLDWLRRGRDDPSAEVMTAREHAVVARHMEARRRLRGFSREFRRGAGYVDRPCRAWRRDVGGWTRETERDASRRGLTRKDAFVGQLTAIAGFGDARGLLGPHVEEEKAGFGGRLSVTRRIRSCSSSRPDWPPPTPGRCGAPKRRRRRRARRFARAASQPAAAARTG